MAHRDQIAERVLEAWALWNKGDHDNWIKLFHPDIVISDPVGAPLKHGMEAVEKSWEAGFSLEPWYVVPSRIIVCGNTAAFSACHTSTLEGRRVLVNDIEIWEMAEDLRVIGLTAFYDPPVGIPEYFLPADTTIA
jgi:ketosteroid isomerase-like protein